MSASDPSPPLPAAAGACLCLLLEENALWAWWNWKALVVHSDTHCGASCPPDHVGKRPAPSGCLSGLVHWAECCVSIKTTTTTPTLLSQFSVAHFQLLDNHKESSMWTVPLSQSRPPFPEHCRAENENREFCPAGQKAAAPAMTYNKKKHHTSHSLKIRRGQPAASKRDHPKELPPFLPQTTAIHTTHTARGT